MDAPTAALPCNTHVHVPPNFSAFETVSDVIAAARAEGMQAVGISNFYDQSVYTRFAAEASAAGIIALFGLEFITQDEQLAKQEVRVNDPANPGRVYLCGKGINPWTVKSERAANTAATIRTANDERAAQMLGQLREYFAQAGIQVELDPESIRADVAKRAGVPVAWVSLQERHIARAIYDEVESDELLYGDQPAPANATDAQALIRSRLLKAGTPGFVPEVPLSFADAHQYILDMGGIPTYPILADGAPELSSVEWPPSQLASWLQERNIHAVELIPNRNASDVVDRYVQELTDAGFIVMAGTEHNTPEQIPLQPETREGAVSELARAAFYDAACVVAAHQERVRVGDVGYVDATGNLATSAEALRQEGARLLQRAANAASETKRIAPRLRGAFASQAGPAAVVAALGRDAEDFTNAITIAPGESDAELTANMLAAAKEANATSGVVVIEGIGAFGFGPSVSAARAALAGKEAESPLPAGRLGGKIAMVTGAAQGFGLGIAEELAAEGASVILADLNLPLAAEHAKRLCAEHGEGRALAVSIDVSDEASCQAAVAEVAAMVGGVDLFVSNAGVLRAESVLTQPVADFDLVTKVNYRGYFLCVQAISPLMAAQHETDPSRWLDIVEVNSKSGLEGSKRNFAYAGSKFGGIGLTQSFALELVEHGIKVNAVCPGNYLDGPLWMDPERGLFVQYLRAGKVPGAKTVADVRAFYEAKVPMGRGCLPIDLARAIFYITEQTYETGQALPVTGGQTMLN